MDKIHEVETAKALMTEAMHWSVMKWLREKKRVRKAADAANAALDRMSEATRVRWSDSVRSAYDAMSSTDGTGQRKKQAGESVRIARGVKDADDEAYRTRMDAEKTFDEAERQLSTTLAKEGCRRAILGWELHERAISKAEAAARRAP